MQEIWRLLITINSFWFWGLALKIIRVAGTLHYIGANELGTSPETVFFIKELKEADILDALRQGRMYVRFNLRKEPLVSLNKFAAHSIVSGSVGITIEGKQISVSEPLNIELIRNGRVFKSFRGKQG